jgi:hypothetical protein
VKPRRRRTGYRFGGEPDRCRADVELWTNGAAVALSTATSASRAFIQAIGSLLKTFGVVDLANQIAHIATIIGEIETLSDSPGDFCFVPDKDFSAVDRS